MKKQKLVQQFQGQADGEEKKDGIFAGWVIIYTYMILFIKYYSH